MTDITKAIIIVAIFVVAIIAILYWFFDTELGHSIRATGCNQNMARANGININLTKIVALVLSNGLVALAGGLLSQYQQRRYRYRSCRSYYRRGYLWQNI